MRAIYYDQYKKIPTVESVRDPVSSPDSVIVRVLASGICRSDWHGWMGHDPDIVLPHVPGHEFAGDIVEVGSQVTRWKQGERVTTPFIQACGKCQYCIQGDEQVCLYQEQAGFTLWGSFAEFVEVRYADVNLVGLPEEMTYQDAAILGCRFGTSYRAVKYQAAIGPGDTVAVFGCGGVGLSAIMIVIALGGQAIAIDPNPAAQKMARDLGALYTFDGVNDLIAKEIMDLTAGGVAASIDAVGHADVLGQSINLLKRRGKHIQVGLLPGALSKPSIAMERVVAHELEIKGSHGIQASQYSEMLSFIRRHDLDLSSLLRSTCNLQEGIHVLTKMGNNMDAGVSVISNFQDMI